MVRKKVNLGGHSLDFYGQGCGKGKRSYFSAPRKCPARPKKYPQAFPTTKTLKVQGIIGGKTPGQAGAAKSACPRQSSRKLSA
jgi:hypothetical protein